MAKRSVGSLAVVAGIILILAAIAFIVWRPHPAPVARAPAVVEYPQGVAPEIPAEPTPPPKLPSEQQAALDKNLKQMTDQATRVEEAQLNLQAARIAARRNKPDMQALVTEIKAVQAQMVERLRNLPGRAEKEKAWVDATARLQAVTEAQKAAAPPSTPEPPAPISPSPELIQAREAVDQARRALDAFMVDARKRDAEYLALGQRARSLREQLDAGAARDPAVIEAQARLDAVNQRSAELMQEQERILRPDAESKKQPESSGVQK